ncbi:hypothetical protein GCM10023096_49450 [Nonomuraea ferruginea]
MNFCLSDLVPPLRWSDTSTITLLTGQPGLPDAWWRSLPMPRVLAAIGPESLGELLTEIAIEHWPAAAVGDVLPALHMLDPDEADEPHVAIALDRAGSWPGLLALTSRELRDQPFVQARPVLTALFSAALVRLSPSSGAALGEGTARPLVRESAGEPASLLAEQPVDEPAPLPHSATPRELTPVDSAAENDLQGDPAQKDRTPHGDLALDEDRTPRSDLAPERDHAPHAALSRDEDRTPRGDRTPEEGPGKDRASEKDRAPRAGLSPDEDRASGEEHDLAARTDGDTADDERPEAEVPASHRELASVDGDTADEEHPEAAQVPTSHKELASVDGDTADEEHPEAAQVPTSHKELASIDGDAPDGTETPEEDLQGDPAQEPRAPREGRALDEDGAPRPGLASDKDRAPGADLAPDEGRAPNANLSPDEEQAARADLSPDEDQAPRTDLGSDEEPAPRTDLGSDEGRDSVEGRVSGERGSREEGVAGHELAPGGADLQDGDTADDERPEAAEEGGDSGGAETPEGRREDEAEEGVAPGFFAVQGSDGRQEEAGGEPVEAAPGAPEEDSDLPQLIEAAFAHLDDKSWAVAQNRVFTDQPSAVDQLAKLFAVAPAEITATEDRLRAMLDEWLASDEAAPYRAHLEELREKIGPSAPKERLIKAADWHGKEIKALEVPAWQFVLATLPDRPLPQRSPASPSAFSAPYGKLPEPPPPAFAPKPAPKPVPKPVQKPAPTGLPPGFMPPDPVPSQFQAFAPAVPVQSEENGKPYQPLKDVSQTRRCFRQPDGRWWLRVDVTAEQLSGGECPLPTGFAAYLGLSPGESKAARSAAGELTMTWHGRPVLESIDRLLADVGAKEGGHLFLTLSDEGVLRARHLPVAAAGAEKITKALRLVGYTAPGGTRDQAARVIATRIGMTGPVKLPDLLTRLRERGDRDLLQLLD